MTAAERIDAWACWFLKGEAGLPAAFAPGSDRVPGSHSGAPRPLARVRLRKVAVAPRGQPEPVAELAA
jgi:hypothetical protein